MPVQRPHRFHEDDDRKAARAVIGDFLKWPAEGGGVLLVSGPRGVGKTRLVDECLNDRRSRGWRWLRDLFGAPGRSRRLEILRQPRGVRRLIVPVPISPFFLHDLRGAEDPAAPRYRALNLLRNLLFGLTNAVDPHVDVRRFGKTLRSRLGWVDYWFSPTGLLLHDATENGARGVNYAVLIPFLAFSFLFWRFDAAGLEGAGTLALLLLAPLLLVAWLLLRWLDWRSLIRFNGYLYSVIHAGSTAMKESEQSSREQLWKVRLNTGLLLAAVLVIASVVGISVDTDLREELLDAIAGSGSAVGQGSNQPASQAEGLLGLLGPLGVAAVGGAGLTALLFGLGFSRSRKTLLDASFDAGNPAWMVNLLRRYLYLLHRCGIEPVLVVDELDKLEKDVSAGVAETAGRSPVSPRPAEPETEAAAGQPGQGCDLKIGVSLLQGQPQASGPGAADSTPRSPESAARHSELDQFLDALVRLKDSLGTEFLWILIAGPELYMRVRSDRERALPGALSTLIDVEVVIGPVGWGVAGDYLKGRSEQLVQRQRSAEAGKVDGDYAPKLAWLLGCGRFAGIKAALSKEAIKDPTLIARVQRMVAWLEELWEDASWPRYLALPEDEPWLITAWQRVWIREGMMSLALKLLLYERHQLRHSHLVPSAAGGDGNREDATRRYADPYQALVGDEITDLVQVGQLLLYSYLTFRYGDSERRNENAEGIEPYTPGREDSFIKLKVEVEKNEQEKEKEKEKASDADA